MIEKNVQVTVTAAYEAGSKGDAFMHLEKRSAAAHQAVDRHSRTLSTNLRQTDRAIQHTAHGFQGLSMNLLMLSQSMETAGGKTSKFHEHMNKGIGIVAGLHAGFMLLRGVAHGVHLAETYLTASHIKAAVAAGVETAANYALAKSHYAVAAGSEAAKLAGSSSAGGASAALHHILPAGDAAIHRGAGSKFVKAAAGAGFWSSVGLGIVKAAAIPAAIALVGTEAIEVARHRATGGRSGGSLIDIYQTYSRATEQNEKSDRQADQIRKAYEQRAIRERAGAQDLSLGFEHAQRARDIRGDYAGLEVSALAERRAGTRRSREHAAEQLRERATSAMEAHGRDEGGVSDVMSATRAYFVASAQAGKGSIETEKQLLETTMALTREKANQASVEQEIAQRLARGKVSADDQLVLTKNLGDAMDKVKGAELKRLEAARAYNTAQADQISNWRSFAADQIKHYESIAASEREKLKSAQEQFGELEPEQHAMAFDIAKKVTRGGGGFKTLDEDERKLFKELSVFEDIRKKQYGEAGAAANFGQLVAQVGADRKMRDAEQAAKYATEFKVHFDNQIKIVLEQGPSITDQLVKQLAPMVQQMQLNNDAQFRAAMAKENFARQQNSLPALGP